MPTAPASPVTDLPPRVVWSSIAICWCLWVVLMTARAVAIGFSEPIDMLARRCAVALAGAALTWLFWRGLRRVGTDRPAAMAVVALVGALPVTVAFAVANWWMFYGWHPTASNAAVVERWGSAATFRYLVTDSTVSWLFFFVGWATIYLFLRAAHRSARAEQAALAAELRALRYQLDPHFLFNALNTLSDLVQSGRADEADAMIVDFSGLLRRILADDDSGPVTTLGEEIALQGLYLALEERRFPTRLATSIDVPDALTGRPVPRLILQPLVENAVKHGLASAHHVNVRITAAAVPGAVRIFVRNEAASAPPPAGLGIGVANVRERLRLAYAGRAALKAEPDGEAGWIAELIIPDA
jgi:signal transduction histidine kinase